MSSTAFHGAEAMCAELVRQLAIAGARVDVAVLSNGGKGNAEIFDLVGEHAAATHWFPCARQFDFATVSALRRCVASRGIDVVHSHKYKTTFHAVAACAIGRFGLVTTYHNWILNTRALRFYAALDKRLARFNDTAVGVSTEIIEALRPFVAANRLAQIDNGVDTRVFRPGLDRLAARQALGLPLVGPMFGFVGRLSQEKGLTYLLQALQHESLGSAQAVLVGDGELRSALETEVRDRGLGQRVHFLGRRRDTVTCYAAMDMLVLPSLVEAFPMVLLEAMACARSVLATRVGEVPRMVSEGLTGHVVAPADAAALVRAMAKVLDNSQELQAMGSRARSAVEASYSSAAMGRKYLEVYQRSLRPHR